MMLLSPDAIKKPSNAEEVMATARIVVCSPYGIACTECKELVIAPDRSRYVDTSEVRHLWTCEDCGHEIETSVTLQIDAGLPG
jgi:hypothetical protein